MYENGNSDATSIAGIVFVITFGVICKEGRWVGGRCSGRQLNSRMNVNELQDLDSSVEKFRSGSRAILIRQV